MSRLHVLNFIPLPQPNAFIEPSVPMPQIVNKLSLNEELFAYIDQSLKKLIDSSHLNELKPSTNPNPVQLAVNFAKSNIQKKKLHLAFNSAASVIISRRYLCERNNIGSIK